MHAGRAGDDLLQLLHGGWPVQLPALILVVARPVDLRSESPHLVIQARAPGLFRKHPEWKARTRQPALMHAAPAPASEPCWGRVPTVTGGRAGSTLRTCTVQPPLSNDA